MAVAGVYAAVGGVWKAGMYMLACICVNMCVQM